MILQRRVKRSRSSKGSSSSSGSSGKGSSSSSSSSGSSGRGGRGGSESELIFASAEVKYEAEFLKNYLSLDEDTRKDMSHQLTLATSRTGSPIKGLIGRCTYSGRDCLFDE